MSDTPIIETVKKLILEVLKEDGQPIIEEMVEKAMEEQGPVMVASELHKQFTGKVRTNPSGGLEAKVKGVRHGKYPRAPGHEHRGRCGPKCFSGERDADGNMDEGASNS